MFTIKTKTDKFNNYDYYISQKILIPKGEIVCVVADGDELEYILENFANIPYHKTKRVQAWTGDIAKFIIAHINWYKREIQ